MSPHSIAQRVQKDIESIEVQRFFRYVEKINENRGLHKPTEEEILSRVKQTDRDSFDKKIQSALIDARVVSRSNSKLINARLFSLARSLKTLFGFDYEPDENIKSLIRSWYEQSLQFLPEKSFDLMWAQFIECWQKAKYPTNADLFCKLLSISDNSPYPPICQKYDDLARFIIRICAVLDCYWSPEPFYLSCRTASTTCDYSPSAMGYILKMLVRDGVLELVEQGTIAGRASRYRFLVDKGKIDVRLINSIQHVNKEVD